MQPHFLHTPGMLRIVPPIVLALLCSCPALAQPATAQNLVARAEALVRMDPGESRKTAEQALVLLARAPDRELELRARYVLCDYLSEQSPTGARAQIALSQALIPKSPRLGWRAAFRLCAAQADESEGHSALARRGYTEAIHLAEGAQDLEFLANALYLRGHLSGLAGDYLNGLIDLRRAHSLYTRQNKAENLRTVVNGIASLYNRMGDFQQAKLYYQQSIARTQPEGKTRDLGVALHNLGRVHENLGEWRQAQRCFERAQSLYREIHFTLGLAFAHRGLASVHNGLGQPEQALREAALAEALSRSFVEARLVAMIQLQKGIALRALKRYPESLAELMKAKPVFEQAQNRFELRDTLRALAQTQAQAGQWRQAYEYEAASRRLSDELFANQIDQRLSWFKVDFDTRAREQENALLLRENALNARRLREEERSRNLLLVAIALGTALLLTLSHLVIKFRSEHRTSQKMALTDELTGLPNRRDALARLSARLDARDGSTLALLIADLDHFKSINDEHGHLIGDEIPQAVAAALRAAAPANAHLGRLGGEEFMILIERTELSQTLAIAERIRERIAAIDATRWFADRTVTISLGAALSVGGETVSTLLGRADRALYAAKEKGRNRCEIELADKPSAGS